MTDIDKMSANVIRFQKINAPKDKPKKTAAPEGCEENIEFQNAKAESLGRSQVSKPDTLENDVKFMMKNPELVMQANMFFDNAYDLLKSKNEERAYEKAAQMMQAYRDEFMMLK
ncbi:MAG: hypothetical protein ACI4SM_02625 [Candidatus Gastranaerophilaceae bacterium]